MIFDDQGRHRRVIVGRMIVGRVFLDREVPDIVTDGLMTIAVGAGVTPVKKTDAMIWNFMT